MAMSLIPASKAVSDTVSPCRAVLATAAATTAAAEVSLDRRPSITLHKNRLQDTYPSMNFFF
jgi:hypothetical protein